MFSLPSIPDSASKFLLSLTLTGVAFCAYLILRLFTSMDNVAEKIDDLDFTTDSLVLVSNAEKVMFMDTVQFVTYWNKIPNPININLKDSAFAFDFGIIAQLDSSQRPLGVIMQRKLNEYNLATSLTNSRLQALYNKRERLIDATKNMLTEFYYLRGFVIFLTLAFIYFLFGYVKETKRNSITSSLSYRVEQILRKRGR